MAENSITGMLKVFKQNFLFDYANTITTSTGSDYADNMKDLDRALYWVSVGSDDTTTETITIEFTVAAIISRLLLLQGNFKYFNIQYWDGAAWQDFTNVYAEGSIEGGYYGAGVYGESTYGNAGDALSAIDYEINTFNSMYFEFDEVSTTKVRIEVLKTIVADEQKYLRELYIGEEIGTFLDDLTSAPSSFSPTVSDTNSIYIKKSNGGYIKYQKSDKYVASVEISELYEETDQAIINDMFDEGQFAILPCGAIPYIQRGWRMSDFYSVIINGNISGEFSVGRVAEMGLVQSFELLEQ